MEGSTPHMSDVARLKELLFQPESEELARLRASLAHVFDRVGTDERFVASLTRTLDAALKEAEVQRHSEVAGALAPLVVKTVRTEIRNGTDDLVEALYPAMGRMITAYVNAEMKRVVESINRRLEENPLMLRLSALTSGSSTAEMAFADSQRLRVEDVLLIRRATGELVGRWPELPGKSDLDHVLGGVLTAINEFTAEAFKSGSSLRQIDLGDQRVYLRVSPNYLLALRCTGTPTAAAEQVFDQELLALSDRHRDVLEAEATVGLLSHGNMLQDVAERLETRLDEMQPSRVAVRRGMRPLTLLATIIAVPLLAWLGWASYVRLSDWIVVERAQAVIAARSDMAGYPTSLKPDAYARTLIVSGLTPSLQVERDVLEQIADRLPGTVIIDELNALPAGADPGPAIAELRQNQSTFAQEVRAANDRQLRGRAAAQVQRAIAALELEAAASERGSEARVRLMALADTARDIVQRMTGATPDMAKLAQDAASLEADLEAAARATLDLGASPPDIASSSEPQRDGASALLDVTERIALAANALVERGALQRKLAREAAAAKAETDRLRDTTTALRTEAGALRDEIAGLKRAVSPRARLEGFVRSHAIFFAEGTTFRDAAGALRVLDQLADLMKADNSVLRVVGYTDEAGAAPANAALAQARADTVAAALVQRGVPPARIVALRRTSPDLNVSPVVGPRSANRRAQFEVGFIGEGGE